jgi:hypothetical protein
MLFWNKLRKKWGRICLLKDLKKIRVFLEDKTWVPRSIFAVSFTGPGQGRHCLR